MEEIKAIIFDLGSVCFDIDWMKINEEMKKKFGISSLVRSNYNEDINALYDKAIRGEISLKNVFKKICEEKNLNVDEVSDYYKELYKKYKTKNEKVFKLINRLKGGVKIACLSDTNDIHFLAYEEQNHLKDFDFVFASFKMGKMKKDKDAFSMVIEQLSVKPEETILVDDSDKNIQNAKAHELKAIKYENYEQLVTELKKLRILKNAQKI